MHKTATLLIITLILAACSNPEPPPPNIVLIMSDDQGYGDFGFTGNEYVQTPVLDEFRHEALLFDRFYVSPVCAPTRASLLTGRYHPRTGTSFVTRGLETMRSEETTLAESFRDHGYATGCFGKWHNGEHYPNNPQGQGFDTFFGFCAGHWNNYFNTKLEYNGEMVPTRGYITDVLTDSALAFIEQNSNRPFLCYIPYNAPHGPFQVPDKYFDKYIEMGLDAKNATVYGMCENIDNSVGKILDKLDELELADHTIVICLTDNGPNGHRYNAGMKGIKAHVDEGGVRTPLLIRYPGVLPGGETIYGLASHIDLLPTLHALCGFEPDTEYPLDGVNLAGYMYNADTIPGRMIFSHQGGWTLNPSPVSVRTPGHRLVIRPNGDTLLYNMIDDPGQKTDISDKFPDLVAVLADTCRKWFEEVSTGVPEKQHIPVGYPEAPLIHLPAHEATVNGTVQFKGDKGWANDWLTGFEKGKNFASWSLEVMGKDTYELFVSLAATPVGTNEKVVIYTQEQRFSLPLNQEYTAPLVPSPDRIPRGEVYEREWPMAYVGNIFLTDGTETISVRFEGLPESHLEVKGIELKRVD